MVPFTKPGRLLEYLVKVKSLRCGGLPNPESGCNYNGKLQTLWTLFMHYNYGQTGFLDLGQQYPARNWYVSINAIENQETVLVISRSFLGSIQTSEYSMLGIGTKPAIETLVDKVKSVLMNVSATLGFSLGKADARAAIQLGRWKQWMMFQVWNLRKFAFFH